MKRWLLGVSLVALALYAQNQKMPPKSPPETAMAMVGGHAISIKYSSPRVRGREGHIFGPGGLIQSTHKQYPVWRAGANAATTLDTEADLTIGDLSVPKGTYTLFVDIANPDQWTLIVNKQTGEWGLAYNSADDLGKVPMQMSQPQQMIEDLKWEVKNEGHDRGRLVLEWEDHIASVNFKVQ